jgi:TolB-like protein
MGMFTMKKILLFSRRIFSLAVYCLALPVIFGCQAAQGISTSQLPGQPISLSRLAVLPFQDLSPDDPAARMVSCPLCGVIFQTEKLTSSAEKVVEDMVLTSLREYKQITLVDYELSAEVYARTAASGPGALPEILQKTGRELNVAGILVGYVFRYRERKGYPYSVEKPASAAFDLHLVRVKDGVIVWRGAFDKTQSSLMENVFQLSSFFSGGGKWVTAKELSADGLAAIMKTFPGIN